MTAFDRFDPFERRISEAIDEIAAARPPAYLDDILRLTARSAQRPRWVFPERLLTMNGFRLMTAGLVAIVAVVALASLAIRPNVGPTPTPSPAATSTTAPAAGIADALQGDWLGAHHDVGQLGPRVGTHLRFTDSGFVVTASNQQQFPLLSSSAATSADGKLQASGSGAGAGPGCSIEATGTYETSLSGSNNTLTIATISDPCAARASAVAGTWWRDGCKSGPCYGDIDAGTYGTEYFLPGMQSSSDWVPTYGALQFTVPTGWSVAADAPTHVLLVPSPQFRKWTADGGPEDDPLEIFVFAQPRVLKDPATCPATPVVDETAGRTASELLTYLRSVPDLTTSSVGDVAIDGNPGIAVDLRLKASSKVSCWGTGPAGEFLGTPFGQDFSWYTLGLAGTQRTRLILVDLGGDSVVGIAIEAGASSWDAMLNDATPIVQSFHFE